MFPVPQKSEELPAKSRVLGLSINGRTRAYSQAALEVEPVLNDSLGGEGLVVVPPDGGMSSRAFRLEGRIFDAARGDYGEPGAVFLLDDQGHRWRMQEDVLVRVDDPTLRLPRIPGRSSYWFGWYAFYSGTDVYFPRRLMHKWSPLGQFRSHGNRRCLGLVNDTKASILLYTGIERD